MGAVICAVSMGISLKWEPGPPAAVQRLHERGRGIGVGSWAVPLQGLGTGLGTAGWWCAGRRHSPAVKRGQVEQSCQFLLAGETSLGAGRWAEPRKENGFTFWQAGKSPGQENGLEGDGSECAHAAFLHGVLPSSSLFSGWGLVSPCLPCGCASLLASSLPTPLPPQQLYPTGTRSLRASSDAGRGYWGKLGLFWASLQLKFSGAYSCQHIQCPLLPTLWKHSLLWPTQFAFQNSQLAGAGFRGVNGNLVRRWAIQLASICS